MTNDFPSRLVELRGKKNMTQQELGDAAGVSHSQISRYEAGSAMPRKTVLAKLAVALDVTPQDLQGVESVVLPLPFEIYETIQEAAKLAGMDIQEFASLYISRLVDRAHDEVIGIKPAMLWSEEEISSMRQRMKPGEMEAKVAERLKEIEDAPIDPQKK